jgi:hypothetical protein
MTFGHHGRRFEAGMLVLSILLAVSGAGLFYFYKAADALPVAVIIWFIASILLTELTLFDTLANQRLPKKVVCALLFHFVPLISLIAYWGWKMSDRSKAGHA